MNERYYIECVKIGETEGGIACGPCCGSIIVSIKYRYNETSKWLTNVEVTGIPNFYLSESDIFDDLIKDEFDEKLSEVLEKCYIDEFDGIKLGYYDDFKTELINNFKPTAFLIKYIIALINADKNEVKQLISNCEGKYIDEIMVSFLK